MATKATRLSTFTLFPELPYDLRYKIWMEARPGPRLIYLHSFYLKSFRCHRVWSDCRNNKRGRKRFFHEDPHETDEQKHIPQSRRTNIERSTGWKSHEPSIALLAVCRESYDILSQFYARAFGSSNAFPSTWFDFKRDTLYLNIWYPDGTPGNPWYLPYATWSLEARYMLEDLSMDVDLVQTLAVDTLNQLRFDYNIWLARILAKFKNLKKIIFVNKNPVSRGGAAVRGPEKMGIVLEDPEMPRLRKILWPKYKGNYDPAIERKVNRQYDDEVAAIAEEMRRSPSEFRQISRTWAMQDMPVVEEKIATYGWIVRDFEEDERIYRRQKEQFRMVLNVRCRGKNTLRHSLGESTAVKEMVAISRKEWSVPEEKICEGVFDEHHTKICIESLLCDVLWKDSQTWEIIFGWGVEET